MTTTARPLIRLSRHGYATLKALSKETKKPMSKIAADAIQRYSHDQFWDQVDRELAAMTPAQWRAYRKEAAIWDATLLDGLPDEDWEDERRAQAAAKARPRRRMVGRSRSRPRS